ncbi:MAG: methyltransferase domain-containing protein [Pseudomonadota bacterium]|nr:methyltransferase domain-containing protein [Pseudomonadota bacterium]
MVDLGCGDFRVGRLIAPHVERYAGVDVVPELIDHNAKQCAMPNVAFHCLDITRDALPPGELCLVREVFQHLSNAQIRSALTGMRQYRYCIVTEAQSANLAGFRPNRDRPAGTSARSFFGSGIRLDLPPFNMDGVEVLFEIPWPEEKNIVLRSFLFAP